jgi:hypothetical protein
MVLIKWGKMWLLMKWSLFLKAQLKERYPKDSGNFSNLPLPQHFYKILII